MSTRKEQRSWMYKMTNDRNQLRNEFVEGVKGFVGFALQHPRFVDNGKIKCPCERCNNLHFLEADQVKLHLYKKGFKKNYFTWYCHGENLDEGSTSSALASNTYRDMVMDAHGVNEERSSSEDANPIDEVPNDKAKELFDLLKAAEDPLYEGSKISVLQMASRMISMKCEFNLPFRCVDAFASLLNEALPNNNLMGRTFYDTKRVLKGLGLSHEKIHTCASGCMLFWKDDAHLEKCSVCGTDRYKRTSKGKLIPAKVLTYFPITPRLQRLFATKNISEEMTWHAKNPRVHGTLAHPSDSEAWKHLDRTYPDFASEARNVRLGLCTDGFSPFGKFGAQYSCWPVILTPYNLPPSMCMKKPFMFLSLIVPGPKNPKGNLDIYMQPLIEELKTLWEQGSETYDISKKQNFTLRAALLWTISDFPAYGMLSGWSTQGKKACPICMEKSKAFWLEHGSKVTWFDCHRQFLPHDHIFRNNKTAFLKNKVEKDLAPRRLSGDELIQRVKDLPKATDGPVAQARLRKAKTGWSKQSILWDLPYWKDLLIRHNLDVMHIEKNFFDQIIHTVMDVKGKTSDTVNSRRDMARLCKRRDLELVDDGDGNMTMPKAPFTLDKYQKKVLCEWVRQLKFPDGFASNLSRCVDMKTFRLYGMKSHDCHVFMERLLPVALKELVPPHVWKAITEISQFFRDMCASTIKVAEMERLQNNIPEILCKLEKIFPPSFFNSMEHLPVHLPYEAKVGGPVQYRWMYPFERYLNHLKKKVGNKARVEGSICNAYLSEEVANFCSNYFEPEVDTKTRDLGRNVNPDVETEHDMGVPEMFRVDCGRATTNPRTRWLDENEYNSAHMYVLGNSGVLGDYEVQFEEYIHQSKPEIPVDQVWRKCETEFPGWLKAYVLRTRTANDVIRALAMGPRQQVSCWSQLYVNGYNFHTYDYGKNKATTNYGVCVEGQDEVDYYGILEDVIELTYYGNETSYRTILFKCKWFDCDKGINIHEQYKLVEVNHTKKYPKYDPFVLSYQANQVYYAPYPSLRRDRVQWWAVFKTKARSDVDAPVEMEVLQEAPTDVPALLCAPEEIPDHDVIRVDDSDDEVLLTIEGVEENNDADSNEDDDCPETEEDDDDDDCSEFEEDDNDWFD